MSLLKDFEALCKYVRECTGDDIVCGLCEYDAGTVGEEPIECPGFESNECFVLKESLRKQYEMYEPVRHGKWIIEECLPGIAVCSICGNEIRGIGCQYTKYCDECGARMDAE